jgi:adenylate cyclase
MLSDQLVDNRAMSEQLVKNIAHPVRAFRLRIGNDAPDEEISIREEVAPFDQGVEPRERFSAASTISEPSADSEVALELALWDSVKDGSPAELEAYLEQYPRVLSRRWPGHVWRQTRCHL